MLTFRQALLKYREDQARVPKGSPGGGRFASEGGGDAGKRPVPNFKSQSGARKSKNALRTAINLIPERDYKRLQEAKVEFHAIRDVGDALQQLGHNRYTTGEMAGLFVPDYNTIALGEKFNGFDLKNYVSTALYEIAHALDYHSSFQMSDGLGPTMQRELAALPASSKWYAEHYGAEALNREVFAELYSAIYAKTNDWYLGGLTRKQALAAFPNSVHAIKHVDFSRMRLGV